MAAGLKARTTTFRADLKVRTAGRVRDRPACLSIRRKAGESRLSTSGRFLISISRRLRWERLASSTETADALPLAAEPSAAAVDLLLDAVETDFSRESLVAMLRSPHFRIVEPPATAAALSALDRSLSEKRYLGDPARLEQIVHGWTDEATRDAAAGAVVIAQRLLPLAEPGRASGLLQRLASLLAEFWRPLEPADRFAVRDQRARAAVAEVIEALRAAHATYHDPEWTFADLAGAVRRSIEASTFAEPSFAHRADAGLSLVDDQAARYGSFDDVVIVGLIENDWPEPGVRNIFYPPALLKALGWPSEQDRHAAAEARFIDLLGSAKHSTTLSTFTLDDEAIVGRSALLDEVGRARLSAVADESVVAFPIFDADALLKEPVELEHLASEPRAWASLRISRPPAERPEFHGVSGPPKARVWSVSGIETYLDCPFKFFARYVLQLDEEPEDEEVLDPRRQGQFVHAVFEEFFRVWQEGGRGGITPENLDEAREVFETVVDRQLERATFSEAEAGLERTRLLGSPAASGLGEAVFRMEAERPVPVIARLLRYSVNGELTVRTQGGVRNIALRGKADRLDLLDDGYVPAD